MQPAISAADHHRERRQHAEAIITKLKAQLGAVLAGFPVELAYLHGSVARGTPLPTSDVDLAVVLSEPVPPAA